ncbi:protein yobA [Klebsiella michiganensis]|uniref:Protein yobA n=1 Tax=Klebsiella michiganensis TaxID=1134687 RepID=A0A7H4PK73_9ENTR|nr:protein yobA [Klebsiella michiganensis]
MPIIAGRALRLSLFLAGCLTAAGASAHAIYNNSFRRPIPW